MQTKLIRTGELVSSLASAIVAGWTGRHHNPVIVFDGQSFSAKDDSSNSADFVVLKKLRGLREDCDDARWWAEMLIDDILSYYNDREQIVGAQ